MRTVLYTWGEFEKMDNMDAIDFKEMRKLTEQELSCFVFRNEDKRKVFYALEDNVSFGPDGIAVKFSYAIDPSDEPVLK